MLLFLNYSSSDKHALLVGRVSKLSKCFSEIQTKEFPGHSGPTLRDNILHLPPRTAAVEETTLLAQVHIIIVHRPLTAARKEEIGVVRYDDIRMQRRTASIIKASRCLKSPGDAAR